MSPHDVDDVVQTFARSVRSLVPAFPGPSSNFAKHTIPTMLVSIIGPNSGAPVLAQLDAIETLKTIARASPIEVREEAGSQQAS